MKTSETSAIGDTQGAVDSQARAGSRVGAVAATGARAGRTAGGLARRTAAAAEQRVRRQGVDSLPALAAGTPAAALPSSSVVAAVAAVVSVVEVP